MTTAPLPGIQHIVVVMLENRSFDNVLGNLYPPSASFDGVPPDASNTYRSLFATHTVSVTTDPPSGNSIYITPNPDPGESQRDMRRQIYDGGDVPTMGGFAQSYHDAHRILGTPGDIMSTFDPSSLPFSNGLASNYAVCDQWFASGPVQTFPNRMFSLCATPGQFGNKAPVNDIDYILEGDGYSFCLGAVRNRTVFELLDGAGGPDPAKWKVYFHDVPLSAISSYVHDAWQSGSDCVSNYDGSDYDPPHGTTFAADVAGGSLPSFAVIEPRYWGNYSTNGSVASSNHPGNDNWKDAGLTGSPIDVRNGEDLLADVVATLSANPDVFNATLLIVIYDEHGGVYDHVPPPANAVVPFDAGVEHSEVYSAYGVRVPAIFVNPAIPAGTIYRLPSTATLPLDHTSIIATVCAQFGLDGPLTGRDAAAPVLADLIPQDATYRKAPPLPYQRFMPKPAPGPRKSMEEHQAMVTRWVQAKGARG